MRLLAAAILCTLAVSPLFGQSAPEAIIKEITATLLPSPPVLTYGKKKSGGKDAKWLEVDVKFDIKQKDKDGPKFGDDLTVNYFILLNNKATSDDGKATLLTGAITHTDIQYDKDLHVGAFVSHQTLARFLGDKIPSSPKQAIINIGVTISDINGEIARKQMNGEVSSGQTPWWENSTKYDVVSNRVLSKDATPFAHLDWDYFLPLKAKQAP